MDEELDLVENSIENIKDLIYTIRGKQVMLDSDVAMLYYYETKKINQAVKRNIERFPEDFCFQLTEEEFNRLRFQFGTLKMNYGSENSLRSQIVTSNSKEDKEYIEKINNQA